MNKYKVEFTITTNYVVDVLAYTEDIAKEIATTNFAGIKANNIEHYYQIGDTDEQITTVYDVTNTDDPFNPQN